MIQDPTVKYCRYHEHQDPNKLRFPSPNASTKKDGYIYIYTYKLLYDAIIGDHKTYTVNNKNNKLNWLQVDNSIISNGNVTELSPYNRNEGYILCKIGMTTKNDVYLRLKEWESHCHHPVINLTPERVSFLLQQYSANHARSNKRIPETASLSKLFQKLSIKEKRDNKNHHDQISKISINNLSTYRNGGFYVSKNSKLSLVEIESFLHRFFWKKYGRGIIHCSGCSNTGNDDKNSYNYANTNTNRHLEWFNVPIKQLPDLLYTIDNFTQVQS